MMLGQNIAFRSPNSLLAQTFPIYASPALRPQTHDLSVLRWFDCELRFLRKIKMFSIRKMRFYKNTNFKAPLMKIDEMLHTSSKFQKFFQLTSVKYPYLRLLNFPRCVLLWWKVIRGKKWDIFLSRTKSKQYLF